MTVKEKRHGAKTGRLIVVTLMLTKQLVCKSRESCSDASGFAMRCHRLLKAGFIFKDCKFQMMTPWKNSVIVKRLLIDKW